MKSQLSRPICSSRGLGLVGLVILFLGLTYSFVTNGFAVAPWNTWSVWERGSEAMVLERIEADVLGTETPPFGLGSYNGLDFDVYDRVETLGVSGNPPPPPFDPYTSEIGGQAYFYSFLWREVGCSSVACVHLVSSALTAATIVGMFLGWWLVTSRGFAWAWITAVSLSPWIVFSARNAFWSPWLYFLPALTVFVLIAARSKRMRLLGVAFVFLAFGLKYVGTGYREFPSFTLLAAGVPFLALVFQSPLVRSARQALIDSVSVVGASALAMFGALCFHAYLLTGNVLTGLNQIWTDTVVRRTYGDGSVDQGFIGIVWKYVWSDWSTDLLAFSVDRRGSFLSVSLGSASFLLLSIVALGILAVRFLKGDQRWRRDSALMVLGLAIPLTLFFAAQGYAFQHPSILFFLWYFMYVPALLFIVIGSLTGMNQWTKRFRVEDEPEASLRADK